MLCLDRDYFHTVSGCLCIRNADFTQDLTRQKILNITSQQKFDVLLSDMAPNATGHKDMDHEQIVDLQTKFVEFASHVLVDNGTLLCKLWEGNRTKHFLNFVQSLFADVKVVKPMASRVNSAEMFVLAQIYKKS